LCASDDNLSRPSHFRYKLVSFKVSFRGKIWKLKVMLGQCWKLCNCEQKALEIPHASLDPLKISYFEQNEEFHASISQNTQFSRETMVFLSFYPDNLKKIFFNDIWENFHFLLINISVEAMVSASDYTVF